MSIDPTEIRLTPEHQAAIAFHAEQEGKVWTELIKERFPVFSELSEEDLQASLAMCDRGMAEIEAGKGMSIEEALRLSLEKLQGFRNGNQ